MESAKVDEAWFKLVAAANALTVLGVLNGNEKNLAINAKDTLTTVPTDRRGRRYKLFLHDVLRISSPGAVLVCAIGLGKNRTADDLSIEDCNLLLPLIKTSDVLSHPTLCSLAIEYQIPRSVQDIPPTLSQNVAAKRTRRPGAGSANNVIRGRRDLVEASGFSSTDLNRIASPEQQVWESASLDGIFRVFNKHLCDEIRRVTVDGELKAAVTTVIPTWAGPVDCLISLEVSESSASRLAMTLFGVGVKLINQARHFTMSGGFSLVIPNSEATMKGASDEAIADVFGLEILTAITESPIRIKELERGMRVTECVSMILIKDGAIINLALNLYRGVRIQGQLYT